MAKQASFVSSDDDGEDNEKNIELQIYENVRCLDSRLRAMVKESLSQKRQLRQQDHELSKLKQMLRKEEAKY